MRKEYHTRGENFTNEGPNIFGCIPAGWLYLSPEKRDTLDRNDLVISLSMIQPYDSVIHLRLVNFKTGETCTGRPLRVVPWLTRLSQQVSIRRSVSVFMDDVRRILTDLGQSTDTSSSPELPKQTPQPLEL